MVAKAAAYLSRYLGSTVYDKAEGKRQIFLRIS